MDLKVDLIKPSLMRIKLRDINYPSSRRSKSIANSFRLVHTRGSYYISIGIQILSNKFVSGSMKRTINIKLSLKWHLHKPLVLEKLTEEQISSVPIKVRFNISEETHDDAVLCLNYPSAVWAEAGRSQSLLKFEKGNLSVWKSSCDLSSYDDYQEFPCFIWIKFNGHIDEIQSLKVFKDIFVKQTNCDVQFCFGKGIQIGAHTTILGAKSRVFATMFQSGMLESRTKQVDIKNFELEIFKEFLHYIYAGRVASQLTDVMSQTLWLLADMYEIEELKKECVTFLLSGIRIDNAIYLLAWAHVHSVNEVKEGILSFMEMYGKEVIELEQWEELAKKHAELSVLATRRAMLKTPSEKENAYKILKMELKSSSEEEFSDESIYD